MKRKFLLLLAAIAVIYEPALSQKNDTLEITAQSILARVDRIMQYPEGEIQGRMKHIFPDGKAFEIDFKGCIVKNDFLFFYSSSARGESLKVLYNMGGEDIWVYNRLAVKLFHKMGIDKYDKLMNTNFSFIDLSNADFQSNYNARITGKTLIKGVDCYKLALEPIATTGEYGLVDMYVTVDKSVPLRIDYHDRDKVIFKFLTVAKTMEKDGRIIPIRYDMLNVKEGTVTILSYLKFDESIKYQGGIFRPEQLGD